MARVAFAIVVVVTAGSCRLFFTGASCTAGDDKTCPAGTQCSETGVCVAVVDGGVVVHDGGVLFDHEDGGPAFIDGGVVVDHIDGGVVVDHVEDGGVAFIDGGVVFEDGGVAFIDGGVVTIDGGVVTTGGGPPACGDGRQDHDELCYTGTAIPAPLHPQSVALGDFDDDGKLDLAVGQATEHTFTIMTGNGAGGFTSTFTSGFVSQGNEIAVADLNHDGALDVFVTGEDNQYNVGLNDRTGTFTIGVETGDGTDDTRDILLGDFNNDGDVDYMAIARNSGPCGSTGLGNGAFVDPITSCPSGAGTTDRGALGDFNGDGKLDFAAVEDTPGDVFVYLGHGDGTFDIAEPVFSPGPGLGNSIAAGDVDGDGKIDLVVTLNSSVVILSGHGDGTFAANTPIAMPGNAFRIKLADVDNDGDTDIVVLTGTPEVAFAFNDGNGGFTVTSAPAPITGSDNMDVGDINRDGRPDFVFGGFNSSSIGVLLSTPY